MVETAKGTTSSYNGSLATVAMESCPRIVHFDPINFCSLCVSVWLVRRRCSYGALHSLSRSPHY